MPKELKEEVASRLNKAAKALYGIDNFSDLICDETIATDVDSVLAFLREKKHPVLGLEELAV
jgi:acetyl-CoA synthase